jgi:predicted PurR-regulated permease PerM
VQPSKQPSNPRNSFWATVVTSIVASILFAIFFQPILTWISNVIVSAIGVFYSGYVDSLYFKAAQNPADYVIYTLFAFIAGFPVVALVSLAIISFTEPWLRRTQRFISTSVISTSLAIGFGVILIPFFIIIAGPAVSIRANATFQRRLMALTPVISDEERKELLGKWAMVSSKVDFENINTQIEELAKKYQTKLPRRAQ